MAQEGPVLERARTFAAEPVASRQARYFVCEWLAAHGRDELSERAGLAVSELAANAVLHTTRPFTVSLDWRDDDLRLELVDSAPDLMAVPVPTTGSATDITKVSETGRGLQIVGFLANRWGVVVDPNIKLVWAEFAPDPPEEPSDPHIVDRRPPASPTGEVRRLRFLKMPVRASIASGLEVEDAIRDIHWVAPEERNEEDRALLKLVDESASLRLAGRHAAMHASAQNLLEFDFEVETTDETLLAVALLTDALTRRAERTPRPALTDEVRAVRQWILDETLRQRDGHAPRAFGARDVEDALAWLFETASTGYVSVNDDGTIVATNASFADALGVRRSSLPGRRFVDLLVRSSLARFHSHVWDAVLASRLAGDVALELDGPDGPVATTLRATRDADLIRFSLDLPSQHAEELIHALQQTLIPPAPPSVPGLDVAAIYHPAQGEVGGDFYDVFEVKENDWCVVLGDVSGKGVDAAIVTAAARHAVRSFALREPVPSGLMAALNRALVDQNSSRFCTVVLARLQHSGADWVTTLTTGGHPFPLLIRHGTATKMGRPGSLLGVFDDVDFYDVSIRLAVGDALVLFTDGIIEARNAAGELFGDSRLHDAVVHAPASAEGIAQAVLDAVLAFQSGGASDDIALVVIRRSDL